MATDLSVIICTHNPRRVYLGRTLDHLRRQSLPQERWELVVVDNRSDPAVSSWCDLSWHRKSHVVREEAIGLTNARACGIGHAMGETLVFVDDDNLLAPDYLAESLRIARECSFLGAWGGRQKPIFERPPAAPIFDLYQELLAIRDVPKPIWTNIVGQINATPHGAGMCLRRRVAEAYLDVLRNDALRRSLDRSGTNLTGSGDHDMAFVACDLGLGVGLFPSLMLEHLMPPERLEEEYLLRLTEGGHFSAAILGYCRSGRLPGGARMTPVRWLWLWFRCRHYSPERWRKLRASIRGTARAVKFLTEREADLRASPCESMR
jgi:glycosyltransferase involved in cell wall biosynthesis